MSGPLHVAYEGPEGRIVVTDSLTYCDERIKTVDVVVGGSFIGEYPTALALRRGARGVIGNACGVGKDQAGIAGLPLADQFGVPCAAVAEASARAADGPDTYESGVISHVNGAAEALALRVGMACSEAAALMLGAPTGQIGRAAELAAAQREIVWEGSDGRVWAMASVSLAGPEQAGSVVCAGSHTAAVTARYVSAFSFPIAGVICHDAGIGKERSGIAGLEPLAKAGIAAASVSSRSARIGDARDTYESGIISHVNRVAAAAGLRQGMPAREAAGLLLRARAVHT